MFLAVNYKMYKLISAVRAQLLDEPLRQRVQNVLLYYYRKAPNSIFGSCLCQTSQNYSTFEPFRCWYVTKPPDPKGSPGNS